MGVLMQTPELDRNSQRALLEGNSFPKGRERKRLSSQFLSQTRLYVFHQGREPRPRIEASRVGRNIYRFWGTLCPDLDCLAKELWPWTLVYHGRDKNETVLAVCSILTIVLLLYAGVYDGGEAFWGGGSLFFWNLGKINLEFVEVSSLAEHLLGSPGTVPLMWLIGRYFHPPLPWACLGNLTWREGPFILQPSFHLGVSYIGVIIYALFWFLGYGFWMLRTRIQKWAHFCIPHTRATRIFLSSLPGDIFKQWDIIRY